MPIPGPGDKQDLAPLTIFYGGNVNVFNDITAERVGYILTLGVGEGNVE